MKPCSDMSVPTLTALGLALLALLALSGCQNPPTAEKIVVGVQTVRAGLVCTKTVTGEVKVFDGDTLAKGIHATDTILSDKDCAAAIQNGVALAAGQ